VIYLLFDSLSERAKARFSRGRAKA
jgi:hypothetical protein